MDMDDGDQYSPSSLGLDPFGSCMDTATTKRKGKNKNKRRFTDEQIRSLESMFESESRLEPRKKVQLAKELGLQPRQVAIWFQNKRARWKSKQLERDYNVLRTNYNSLASRFESLKKEKLALATQVRKLNELMQKQKQKQGQGTSRGEEGGNYAKSGERDSKGNGESGKCVELDNKERVSLEKSEQGGGGLGGGGGGGVQSDEDSSIKAEYLGLEEEADLMAMVEPTDGSMTSQEDWGSLDSDGLFDQANAGYQWWDFWSS